MSTLGDFTVITSVNFPESPLRAFFGEFTSWAPEGRLFGHMGCDPLVPFGSGQHAPVSGVGVQRRRAIRTRATCTSERATRSSKACFRLRPRSRRGAGRAGAHVGRRGRGAHVAAHTSGMDPHTRRRATAAGGCRPVVPMDPHTCRRATGVGGCRPACPDGSTHASTSDPPVEASLAQPRLGPFTRASRIWSTMRSTSWEVTLKCGVKRREFSPPWITPIPWRRMYSSVLPLPYAL